MRFCFFSFFVLVVTLSIISCQKEIDPYSPVSGTDSTGTDATITDTTAGAYQPLTVGSFWKYKDSASGNESIATIDSITKRINNILYKGYLSTTDSQTDTLWMAAPSPNYYLVAQSTVPNSTTSFDLTFYYLNDTASAGYSMQYTAGSGSGITTYIKTTVVAKDTNLTVEGKNYTNVIQTQLDLSYNIFGSVINYGTYNYFIAKDIGIIKIRSVIPDSNGLPSFQTCSNLIDYNIK